MKRPNLVPFGYGLLDQPEVIKLIVALAALGLFSSALEGKDFFGLPATPVPSPVKPTIPAPAASEPTSSGLAALKQGYQQEVGVATKPARDRYAAALQTLNRSLVQKNDLPGVLVVQTELSSLTGTAPPASPSQSGADEKAPPPEFTALKQRYEKDLEASSKAPRDRYAIALKSLLRTTLEKGDLSEAAAIKAELEIANPPPLSPKEALLTSCWWQIKDVVLEFTPDGRMIRHGDTHGWGGKSWKLSPDGKGVECTYSNGEVQTYLFKNGGLAHFDPSWGQFKKLPKK